MLPKSKKNWVTDLFVAGLDMNILYVFTYLKSYNIHREQCVFRNRKIINYFRVNKRLKNKQRSSDYHKRNIQLRDRILKSIGRFHIVYKFNLNGVLTFRMLPRNMHAKLRIRNYKYYLFWGENKREILTIMIL